MASRRSWVRIPSAPPTKLCTVRSHRVPKTYFTPWGQKGCLRAAESFPRDRCNRAFGGRLIARDSYGRSQLNSRTGIEFALLLKEIGTDRSCRFALLRFDACVRGAELADFVPSFLNVVTIFLIWLGALGNLQNRPKRFLRLL